MKLRMYMDVWPGMDPTQHYVSATNRPMEKGEGCQRVAFVIDVPDHVFYKVDVEAPMPAKIEDIAA